jgi:hypothetical protein
MKHVVPVPKVAEEAKTEDPYKRMSDQELFEAARQALADRDGMQ